MGVVDADDRIAGGEMLTGNRSVFGDAVWTCMIRTDVAA